MHCPNFLSLFKLYRFKPQSAHRLKYYPPFWLMRIKILEMDPLWKIVRIRLPLTGLSKNPGGGIFAGFQGSLADPIAALACSKTFPGCEVWTRHLQINFICERRTDLDLHFNFSEQQLADITEEMQERGVLILFLNMHFMISRHIVYSGDLSGGHSTRRLCFPFV
ncbi:MAG: DUF4442 domain-containing protein [Thiohalomonas sp.]|nr:DUF4442 domain-containing protein [Thiohalomonas sp.]